MRAESIHLLSTIARLLRVMWEQFPSCTLARATPVLMLNTLALKAVMLTDVHPSASNQINTPNSANGRERSGRSGSRPSIRTLGECDPFGIDIAPLSIFENQVMPVGVHNLSKSFRPNMTTIHVLTLGTKFIPKWKKANVKQTFQKFGIFCRRLQNAMFFFVENKPEVFCLNKQF